MSGKSEIKVGIIGGTGLDQDSSIIDNWREISIPSTPYGEPSDSVMINGTIAGIDVYIMGRHGRQHNINPSNVNYRANLWSLKELGCSIVLVTTACGSLKQSISPGDMAVLDQYIDRTSGRQRTFFAVSHIPQSKPFNGELQQILRDSCRELTFKCHESVTAVTIEGPRFSTLAESRLYQSWGCDIVNMTTVPEAQLAAELGLIYGSLALITDYDCWHSSGDESVNVELVMSRLKQMSENAKQVIVLALKKISQFEWQSVLENKQKEAKSAIMTE